MPRDTFMAQAKKTPRKAARKAAPRSAAAAGPRIVLVDDDATVRKLIAQLLSKRYTVDAFGSSRAALAHLKKNPAHLIICDYKLNGTTGVAFLQDALRVSPESMRMLVTGFYDADAIMASVNEAQIDFVLTKPLSTDSLLQAVEKLWDQYRVRDERDRLALKNKEMLKELRGFNRNLEATVKTRTRELTAANRKLKKALQEIETKNRALTLLNESLNVLATVDPLTNLYNRREFLNRLSIEWDRHERYDRPFSLIMADIDHFKVVNDTHGHACGDTVLRGIADVMQKHKRRQDVVCRYGGEEFMVLLPETRLDAAVEVAEKLRRSVSRHHFACGRKQVKVQISLGVSGIVEHDPATEADLVAIADQGLYRAKGDGRNRTVVLEALNSTKVLKVPRPARGAHAPPPRRRRSSRAGGKARA